MKPEIDLDPRGHKFLTDRLAASLLEDMDYSELCDLNEYGRIDIEKDITSHNDWEPRSLFDTLYRHEVFNWDEYFEWRTEQAIRNGDDE